MKKTLCPSQQEMEIFARMLRHIVKCLDESGYLFPYVGENSAKANDAIRTQCRSHQRVETVL